MSRRIGLLLRFIGFYYASTFRALVFRREPRGLQRPDPQPFGVLARRWLGGQGAILEYARLVFSRIPIVWLASVSKSGNTWVRYLLHNALFAASHPDLSPEHAIPHANTVLTVYAGRARRTRRGAVLVKTHSPPWADTGWMRFLVPLSAGAIYLYRNPKDVCLSQINHVRLVGIYDDQTDAELAMQFLDGTLFPAEGDWYDHIQQWLSVSEFPVLPVTYEEMKRNASGALASILRFLGEDVDDDVVGAAVARSSFDAMRALEDASGNGFGYRGAHVPPTVRFVNKGASDQSIEHLGEPCVSAFERRLGEKMRRMGYEMKGPGLPGRS